MNKRLTAIALSTAALLLGAAAPAGAVPETEIKPAQLERGADMGVPHVVGKTIVDGDVRIRIRAGTVRLLGRSGEDYVVGTADKTSSSRHRILRVTPEGDRTVLLRGVPIWSLELSDDGTQLAGAYTRRGKHTRVRVFSAADGAVVAERRFGGSLSVLDLDGGVMILGGWGPARTFSWTPEGDLTERLLGRAGYDADIGADRIATMTKDPYRGGCTVVTTLAAPRERLWKSCDERVAVFSPRGSRMTTIHILSDGLGPRDVRLRKAGGRLLAHYMVRADVVGARADVADRHGRRREGSCGEVRGDRLRARYQPAARAELPARGHERAALSAARIIGTWSGSRANAATFSPVRRLRLESAAILTLPG